MSKEYLEALGFIKALLKDDWVESVWETHYEVIKQALQRLESIENTKPNEALKSLECLYEDAKIESGWVKKHCITYTEEFEHNDRIKPYYETIKQALIKAQEQEKVLNELIKLVKDLEPTFNRKGVSSDTDILGTIIKDYFYDNESDLLKEVLE